MRILGVDTATSTASVALVENRRLIAQEVYRRDAITPRGLATQGNHAEILLRLMQNLLRRAETSLASLSVIAVTIGPGSFTGLRIALATVKGLAYGAPLPVAGISTLHAMAASMSDFDGVVCPLLDARKSEVYTARFAANAGQLTRLSPDAVLPLADLVSQLRASAGTKPVMMLGDGAERYSAELRSDLGQNVSIGMVSGRTSVAAQAALLAGDGATSLVSSSDLGALVPLYLRSSSAQVKRSSRESNLLK